MMTHFDAPMLVRAMDTRQVSRITGALRWRLPDRYGRWALAQIATGILSRLGLLLLDWPRTDSDEGTMGLMALHLVTRGEHSLFFYSRSYMGTLQ
jgi:hypothetical protein